MALADQVRCAPAGTSALSFAAKFSRMLSRDATAARLAVAEIRNWSAPLANPAKQAPTPNPANLVFAGVKA